MTKKDYIAIAGVLKDSYTIGEFIEGIIPVLKNDNPNFNEKIFRDASANGYHSIKRD